jgi:hypothetical protein
MMVLKEAVSRHCKSLWCSTVCRLFTMSNINKSSERIYPHKDKEIFEEFA